MILIMSKNRITRRISHLGLAIDFFSIPFQWFVQSTHAWNWIHLFLFLRWMQLKPDCRWGLNLDRIHQLQKLCRCARQNNISWLNVFSWFWLRYICPIAPLAGCQCVALNQTIGLLPPYYYYLFNFSILLHSDIGNFNTYFFKFILLV